MVSRSFGTYFSIIVLLVGLFQITHQTFQVYSPQCSRERHQKQIEYNLGNFGHIPYGRTERTIIATPKNKTFCDGTNQTQATQPNMALLVERGDCKFTKKIIQAQKKGYTMVIIYDNTTSSTPKIVMNNDGNGHLVQIPSIFISRDDGLALIETLKACQFVMTLTKFDLYIKQISDVLFWLDIQNRESFVLLRDFHRDYYPALKQFMNLTIKFRAEPSCSTCTENDCLNGRQKLCLTMPLNNPDNLTGRQILLESQRSYLIYQTDIDKSKWWQYMLQFDKNLCLVGKKDIPDCAEMSMKSVGIDTERIMRAMKEQQGNSHEILQKMAQDASQGQIFFYPDVTINKVNQYGSIKAPELFNFVCSSLKKAPCQCFDGCIIGPGTPWGIIIFCIFVFAFVTVLILCAYRAYVMRATTQQMNVQVNRMVEQYVNLTETNVNKSQNH